MAERAQEQVRPSAAKPLMHIFSGVHQSIPVSLRTARCFCGCDEANDLIRETIKFATASWTIQEVNALDMEMTHHRWSGLNLNWPNDPTSWQRVPDRLLPEGNEMA